MKPNLNNNLNSGYFTALSKMQRKNSIRKVYAYVESYDDIGFWGNVLRRFETDQLKFDIFPASRDTLTKGKKEALSRFKEVGALQSGESLVVCVDSDYDYLLQDTTYISSKINRSDAIFQTYCYSIENYWCMDRQLDIACMQATNNSRRIFDFSLWLKNYSEVIYELFIWSVLFYRKGDKNAFKLLEFCKLISIGHSFHIADQGRGALQRLHRRTKIKLEELETEHASLLGFKQELTHELLSLGVLPHNCYLFIQGHTLMEKVALSLLRPVCNALINERLEEIHELGRGDDERSNSETHYRHSTANIYDVLKFNTEFRDSEFYKRIEADIQRYIDKYHFSAQ